MDPTQNNPAPNVPPRQPDPLPQPQAQPPQPQPVTQPTQPQPSNGGNGNVNPGTQTVPAEPAAAQPTATPPAPQTAVQPAQATPVTPAVATAPATATAVTPSADVPATPPAATTAPNSPTAGAATPPPSPPTKRRRFGRKAWLIAAAAVVVVVGIVAWQVVHARNEATWNKATAYYEKAEYDKAADALKGMGMPSDPKRLQVYAQTMLATRQFDKALEGYQKLYQVKNDSATKLVIGNIYNEQKKPDEAISTYKDIIASDPAYAQAYVNLASIYAMQGKTPEAITTIDQGIGKVPKSVTLHELKVSLLVSRKGSAEYNQAVAALRQVNPDDPLLRSLKE